MAVDAVACAFVTCLSSSSSSSSFSIQAEIAPNRSELG